MDQRNSEFIRLLSSSGWSQARASREIGVTTGAVSRYLSGEITPSLPVLRRFADVLQEPLLLPGESGGLAEWRDGGGKYLEEWEADIIASLRRVDRPARMKVISAIRDIIDAVAKPVRYTTHQTKEAPVRDPAETGFPHPGDEEAVMSALSEVVQVAREERAKEIEALRSRLPKSSTSPRPSPGHPGPKPRRSS